MCFYFTKNKSCVFLYKQLSKKFFEDLIICGPNFSNYSDFLIHFIWEIEYFLPVVTV